MAGNYSSTRLELLDPLLAAEVLDEIRIGDSKADPFRLYQNPDLTKNALTTFNDKYGKKYRGIIALGDISLPLAVGLAYTHEGRNTTAYLLDDEFDGELHPKFDIESNEVLVVRQTIQNGEYLSRAIDDYLPGIGARVTMVFSILDNDAEPDRTPLSELMARRPDIEMFALTRASLREYPAVLQE